MVKERRGGDDCIVKVVRAHTVGSWCLSSTGEASGGWQGLSLYLAGVARVFNSHVSGLLGGASGTEPVCQCRRHNET